MTTQVHISLLICKHRTTNANAQTGSVTYGRVILNIDTGAFDHDCINTYSTVIGHPIHMTCSLNQTATCCGARE